MTVQENRKSLTVSNCHSTWDQKIVAVNRCHCNRCCHKSPLSLVGSLSQLSAHRTYIILSSPRPETIVGRLSQHSAFVRICLTHVVNCHGGGRKNVFISPTGFSSRAKLDYTGFGKSSIPWLRDPGRKGARASSSNLGIRPMPNPVSNQIDPSFKIVQSKARCLQPQLRSETGKITKWI